MIALTGATGLVGRALVPLADVTLGRRAVPGLSHREWTLTGPAPDLRGVTTLIHAAFTHLPGRYRGGEGDDPAGFRAANLDGTCRLFDAAVSAGVEQVVFLSSRAVFDGLPDDTPLTEARAPGPASLYGQVKAEAEAHLFTLPLTGQSLRATGIYGPGPGHKWTTLFVDYLAGRPVPPRRGTELHVQDLTKACRLLLNSRERGAFHASDILLDRQDLLAVVQTLTGCPHPLPPRSDRAVNPLICQRFHAMGWTPGGMARLRESLPVMLADSGQT